MISPKAINTDEYYIVFAHDFASTLAQLIYAANQIALLITECSHSLYPEPGQGPRGLALTPGF